METTQAKLIHFTVDSRASKFSVQAFATGMHSAMGHNPTIGIRTFSGEVDFDPETLAGSGFRLKIQASSLGVLDDISDKDRREIEKMMNDKVLDTTNNPEIVYEVSTVAITRVEDALYSATLNGLLKFHGVSQAQPITARIAVFGDMLRASGKFSLMQSDYGIKPITVAGGALKVKDELQFSFEMVLRKQA